MRESLVEKLIQIKSLSSWMQKREKPSPQETEMSDLSSKLLSELEGECRVGSIRLIRINWVKSVLLIVPVVFSLVGLLLLKYYRSFRVMVFYSEVQHIRQATHVYIKESSGRVEEIEEIVEGDSDSVCFYFMKLKYSLQSDSETPVPVGFRYWQSFKNFFNEKHYSQGNDDLTVGFHEKEFGANTHEVDIPLYFEYMFEIMTKPFFLIQYIIVVMFILEKLVVFAVMLLGVTIITTSINYALLYMSFKKTKEIAEQQYEVRVVRNSQIMTIKNTQLVSGDIIQLHKSMVVPCDSIVVRGEAFVNEASLTGQSIPIGKFAIESQKELSVHSKWLLQGSVILETKQESLAIAINTGYSTRKGRIIRKIVNRTFEDPEMFRTALYFLLESLAVGVLIYFATLPILLAADIGVDFKVYRFFDYVGFSCPPTFPIYFNTAYSFSLIRLNRKNIYGTQPQKTVECSMLKTLCFDKTGTLTENTLKIEQIFLLEKQNETTVDKSSLLLSQGKGFYHNLLYSIFASCHTVKEINGELLGDQIDLKMFEATGCRLLASSDPEVKFAVEREGRRYEVLRINQFESKNQHMSVLVRSASEGKHYVFVKGAPQKIHANSIEQFGYFEELLKRVSLNGQRAIGMAYIELSEDQLSKVLNEGLSKEYVSANSRKELNMIGLVAFENKLKVSAKAAIHKLEQSLIGANVITGDNIYIAIETARKAGIINQTSGKVVILEGKNQRQAGRYAASGSRVFLGKILNLATSQKELKFEQQIQLQENTDYLTQKCCIAVDNEFLEMSPQPELSSRIKVFARITPENKALVVRTLKEQAARAYSQKPKWDQFTSSRPKVGMVGDGANDLMALKEADIGFGICNTDASYAASFSISQLLDIDEVIRESKNASTVILQMLRYYGNINFLKITCAVLMMTESTYFASSQLSYFNFTSTLIVPLALSSSSTPSEHSTPLRPITNMLSLKNHLIYWGLIVINSTAIIIGYFYYRTRDSFVPNPHPYLVDGGYYSQNHSTTAVFVLVQLPFILTAVFVYNNGPRFKRPIFNNYFICILIILNVIADVSMYFLTEKLHGFLKLMPIPSQDAAVMLGIMIAFMIIAFGYSKWVELWRFEQKQLKDDMGIEDSEESSGRLSLKKANSTLPFMTEGDDLQK